MKDQQQYSREDKEEPPVLLVLEIAEQQYDQQVVAE